MKQFSNTLTDQEFLILSEYLTSGSKRRSGMLITPSVKFIVAHDTGNPGSTARGNVRYYERTRDEKSASAHVFVDDQQIIECIPALTATPEKAWHVLYDRQEDNIIYGYNSNDAAIGVEYCYGQNINANEAYRRYVWVMAYACWKYGLDPRVSIIGHHILDPGRKIDPVNGLLKSRRSYSQLLDDVVAVFQYGGGVVPLQNLVSNYPKTVTARGVLNVRMGEPFRRAPVSRQVAQGASFQVANLLAGEKVNGIDQWFDLGNQEFCWSGAVS